MGYFPKRGVRIFKEVLGGKKLRRNDNVFITIIIAEKYK